jgi:hypothetical protein
MGSRNSIYCYYRGESFRSRLEARYKIAFDDSGIDSEYEKDQIRLSTGDQYRPDFWLPQFRCYAEIKPDLEFISDAEASKLIQFVIDGYPLLLFHGLPGYNRPGRLGVDARQRFNESERKDASLLILMAGFNPGRFVQDPFRVVCAFDRTPYKPLHFITDRANDHQFDKESEDSCRRDFEMHR